MVDTRQFISATRLIVALLLVLVFYSSDKSIEQGTAYTATAYSLQGRTASGSYVRRGIVAADTRIHKLGSRIWINAGRYSGMYTVADTGGRIKGRTLDIWMPNSREARQFGRRKVYVRQGL